MRQVAFIALSAAFMLGAWAWGRVSWRWHFRHFPLPTVEQEQRMARASYWTCVCVWYVIWVLNNLD